MSYKYHFHEPGQKDYEETLLWYLKQSPKAASGFANAVDDAIYKICNSPSKEKVFRAKEAIAHASTSSA